MTILAIDYASITGWAISPKQSGVWDLSRLKNRGSKFNVYAEFLENKICGNDVDKIFFEKAMFFRGGAATEINYGFKAITEMVCAQVGIPCEGIHVATIKKWAIGKGNADKVQMLKKAREVWGDLVRVQDDNHADALWIWDYVMNNYTAEQRGEK